MVYEKQGSLAVEHNILGLFDNAENENDQSC